MKELAIAAAAENLAEVLSFVSAELDSGGCDPKAQHQILLCVEEIFINIARYAYVQKTGGMVIRIGVSQEVSIIFEDYGTPYNPLKRKAPDIAQSAEEREIGGLGIFIVKRLMDHIQYFHTGHKNVLIIRKTPAPPEGGTDE